MKIFLADYNAIKLIFNERKPYQRKSSRELRAVVDPLVKDLIPELKTFKTVAKWINIAESFVTHLKNEPSCGLAGKKRSRGSVD
jgi:hypothetical protein